MASEYTYDEEGETWPFFVIAILSFVLIPITASWLYKAINGNDPTDINKHIRGSITENSDSLSVESQKMIREFQRKQRSAKIFNKTLVVVILGWALVAYIGLNFTKEADLKGAFDPYTILDVSMTASEREIKSKYRKLSLKYHPDKSPQNAKEEMEAVYLQIQMAYKALTDEVTRQNFLKYGHPDGPQDVTHGIAIPRFLVEGKYSPVMVVVYFLLVGVLLPLIVGSWWTNVKTHTKKGIHVETAALFTRKLVDRNPTVVITPNDIIDWLCDSEEVKSGFGHLNPEQIKGLIQDYLGRKFDSSAKSNTLEADKMQIVATLPKLINGLIDIATVFRQVDIVTTASDLRKCIYQATKTTGRYQDLLQLPYINPDIVSKQPVRKLGKLFTLSKEEVGKTLGIDDSDKVEKALEVAARIPILHIISAEFVVPGEIVVPPSSTAHLCVNFMVKSPKHKSSPEIPEERLKFEETMEFLKDPFSPNGQQPTLPYSFCPYYPGNVLNSWTAFVVSQQDNKLIEGSNPYLLDHADLSNVELSQDTWIKGESVIIGTFRIPFTKPTPTNHGKFHYRLILKNNAYFGSDVDIPLEMRTQPPPYKPSARKVKSKSDDESDSESDISDPEEDSIAGALAALRGASVKKSAAPANESGESDGESDNESVFTDINTDTEDELEK